MKNFSLVLLCAVTVASCARGISPDVNNGSKLTSLSVNLPDKSKLPESLKNGDIVYCFQVAALFMALDSQPIKTQRMLCSAGTEGPAVITEGQAVITEGPAVRGQKIEDAFVQTGSYASSLKLEAQLSSALDYQVTLVIGHRSHGGQLPSTWSLAPISTSESNDAVIDMSKEYFAGSSMIHSKQMQGKTSISTTIKLTPFSGGTIHGDDESILVGSGSAVDLEVNSEFDQSTPVGHGN